MSLAGLSGTGFKEMKLRAPLSVVIALTAGLALAGDMPWAKDFASAQKTAMSSGKLIMLDFYTDW